MEQTEIQQPQNSEINNEIPPIKQPIITKKKLLLITIVVFVLATVLVVLMGFGGGKTVVDDISGWKTYADEVNGLTFKYPQSWSMENIATLRSDKGELLRIYTQVGSPPGLGFPCEQLLNEDQIILGSIRATKSTTTWRVDDICGHDSNPNGSISTKVAFSNKNIWYLISFSYSKSDSNNALTTLDKILSTFKFVEIPLKTVASPTPTVVVHGAEARDIGYVLPAGWVADLEGSNDQSNDLFIYPTEGGGFIAINVYDYDPSVSEQEYYCEVQVDYCIDGVTTFERTTIGNLDGYQAISVDNSGGGAEYFGSRFDKFYTISTYSPYDPVAEYNINSNTVFDSLRF